MGRPRRVRGRYDVKCSDGGCYDFIAKFDTNDTSAPDGIMHDDDGVVYAYVATGRISITFPAVDKPQEVLHVDATVWGANPRLKCYPVSYTQATGVLLLEVSQEQDDGADTDPDNGISVAAATNNVTISVRALCSRLAE